MIRVNPYAEKQSSPHSFSKVDNLSRIGDITNGAVNVAAVSGATRSFAGGCKWSSSRLVESSPLRVPGRVFEVSARDHTEVTNWGSFDGFLRDLPMSTMRWRRILESSDLLRVRREVGLPSLAGKKRRRLFFEGSSIISCRHIQLNDRQRTSLIFEWRAFRKRRRKSVASKGCVRI